MIISVFFEPAGRIVVNPEKAIVRAGETVTWEVDFRSVDPRFRMQLQWTIYFQNAKHPFGARNLDGQWEVRSFSDEKNWIEPGAAKDPGDYKYGVRVRNANTGELLDDEDPWLIVQG